MEKKNFIFARVEKDFDAHIKDGFVKTGVKLDIQQPVVVRAKNRQRALAKMINADEINMRQLYEDTGSETYGFCYDKTQKDNTVKIHVNHSTGYRTIHMDDLLAKIDKTNNYKSIATYFLVECN